MFSKFISLAAFFPMKRQGGGQGWFSVDPVPQSLFLCLSKKASPAFQVGITAIYFLP